MPDGFVFPNIVRGVTIAATASGRPGSDPQVSFADPFGGAEHDLLDRFGAVAFTKTSLLSSDAPQFLRQPCG